jgi:RHH-type proline utilization regulon transcriptional repressor/proline dehydrogenase/delta 1-pyrroline-5-carboxylate dehydrogenase
LIFFERLSELYRSAAVHHFVRHDGSKVNKFVNLDMESYRDLAVTAQVFIHTLDQEEFRHHHAGMALQAYLPDSYHILQQITAWARKRVAGGGSPIKIRIVKGANMEMEKIESAIFDWPLAPFDNKLEVDANWKRMVDFGMQPENIRSVRMGIASHNLFDLAYAYLVARRNRVSDFFSFEMIEGMANHVRRAILLAAETGSKNATIVTAMSDRDQAISNVLYSAFGNSGQKCSATSLLILEPEVYEDADFKRQLVDAARSISTGSAWDFSNKMGPLIRPPQGDLKRALTVLEPGESWALRPQNIDDNPYIWTPGIKWDVRPQSYTHMTEFFGPLLGVLRADDLEHAIALANQTGYGLTSGLESLDPREEHYWTERIKAGNLYINRGTTGAVTLRQPFGGMGKSALGMGMKAGGPQYVVQFMAFEETGPPTGGSIQNPHSLLKLARQWQEQLDKGELQDIKADIQHSIVAIKSYSYQVEREFSRKLDYFHLRGQDNILRYLPVGTVVIRLHEDDSLFDTLARIAAAQISGCKLRISSPKDLDNQVIRFLDTKEGQRIIGGNPVVFELDKELIKSLPIINRIRYAAPERVPQDVQRAAAEIGFYIARTPVMMDGLIELLQYYQQQSICNNYHRYGNLGERAPEFETKN